MEQEEKDAKEKWKTDIVAFVEHWIKEKCPATDNPADVLAWVNEHFADALAQYEVKYAIDLTMFNYDVFKAFTSPTLNNTDKNR
jgi:hypothetical protein